MDDALTTIADVPRRPPRADAGIVAVLMVWALIEAFAAAGPGATWQRVAFAVAVTGPLLWRRRAPVVVLLTLIGALAVRVALVPGVEDSTFPFPSLLVATFSVALHARSLAVAAVTGVLPVAAMLSLLVVGYYEGPVTVGQLFILGFFVYGAWVAGWLVRVRAAQARAARTESERLAGQAATIAAQAVAGERARIARELHDVVAHSLSIVAVQAGAAEELVDLAPDTARRHIAAARRTAREALVEMRHVLDVLRDDGEAPALAPQPTLDGVPDLVEEARAAGLPVTLEVTGERGTVPPGVDLAGFRIVQEALTNVRRHAGPVPASVRVGYAEKWIDVEVHNSAGADGPPAEPSAGRGLVGMRERARLYGGTLDAGPDGDGFTVRVRLPKELT